MDLEYLFIGIALVISLVIGFILFLIFGSLIEEKIRNNSKKK